MRCYGWAFLLVKNKVNLDFTSKNAHALLRMIFTKYVLGRKDFHYWNSVFRDGTKCS